MYMIESNKRLIEKEGVKKMLDNKLPDKTSDRILIAASELIAEFGYAGVSMRQIARKAGCNEATIYHYYAGKKELMDAITMRMESILNFPEIPYEEYKQSVLSRVEALGLEGFLEQSLLQYIKGAKETKADILWEVSAQEQFVNPNVGRLTIRETDRVMVYAEKMFSILQEAGYVNSSLDPMGLAWEFQYVNRALHQELLIRERFNIDPDEMYRRHKQRIALFSKLIQIK